MDDAAAGYVPGTKGEANATRKDRLKKEEYEPEEQPIDETLIDDTPVTPDTLDGDEGEE